MSNKFNPIKADSELSNIINQFNNNFSKLDIEAVTKVFYGAGGQKRLIEGRLPNDLGYGTIIYDTSEVPSIYIATDASGLPILKVAKSGQDATTASNDNLIFNSAQNIFKIADTNTASVTTSSYGSFSTVVPHGLSHIPAIVAYAAYPTAPANTWAQTPFTVYGTPGSLATTSLSAFASAIISVDTANITFTVVQVGGGALDGVWRFKYYVLQETAAG